MFAVDSVPAIFGITRDPFIVFTSNLSAILGLRALYFLLAGVMGIFYYLTHGLSAILVFVGIKMNLEFFIPHEAGTHLITPGMSLGVIAGIIATAVIASLVRNKRQKNASGTTEQVEA
jgi:tellurite resistance protein TerC